MRSRLSFLIVLAVALAAVPVAPASAHTEVQRALPAPGEVVADAVDRVELQFLDPVLPTVTIGVRSIGGDPVVGLGDVVHSDDGRTASLSFEPLTAAGNYIVRYEFVSIDGDAQADAYRFTYAPATDDTDRNAVGVAVVGLVLLGLVAALAVAVRRRRAA
ncbi:copper resistance CopC family protein [Actinospongicola halichondriae]|uniref:copper resistance CopC family protein n=1 Tax=Actinospongicola halichondriae TaxID=3236844 RepID=UPI003D4CD8D7